MKNRIAAQFPFLLVGAGLLLFAWQSFRQPLFADDFIFINTINGKSAGDSAFYFYENFNGRLTSHFFLSLIFKLPVKLVLVRWLYRLFLLFSFIAALALLVKSFFRKIRSEIKSPRESVAISSCITAFFFLFFLDGSFETWYWISATGVHLVSLILAMAGFSVLFSRLKTALKALLLLIAFFLAGGFSETYACMYLLLLAILFFRIKDLRIHTFVSIAALAGGLLLNLLSPGIKTRLGWLPEFNYLQALKNSFHTMAEPFLRWPFLPLKLVLVAGVFLYAKSKGIRPFAEPKKKLKSVLLLFGFIFLCFFSASLVLSDLTPDRAASLAYLAGVLFLFGTFIFPGKNISGK
jgi:hypothetical protein